MRRRFWGGFLLLWPLMGFSFSNEITDLQINLKDKQHCRVTFNATAPIRYQLLTLVNPDRLVIDITEGHLGSLVPSDSLKGTPIKDIRSGAHDPHTLRIVFDLNTKIIPHVIAANKKLILDLQWSGSSINPSSRDLSTGSKSRAFARDDRHTPSSRDLIAGSKPHLQPQVPLPVEISSLPSRSSKVIIVIDPGHGGRDPGASGKRGQQEKDIVFQISKDLQNALNRQPGFKAYLTRQGDYYLTLRERLAIARRYKADMFIAIHADAIEGGQARGASVFALSQRGATSEAARWLAKRENESELMGGVELSDKNNLLKSVLINLSQAATVRASLGIGERIIDALGDVGSLHHHRIEQAAFVVLKSPDIPSLLVETGFISNPSEEKKLANSTYQQRLAYALMEGIRSYFVHSPPRGTWLAQRKKR